MAATENMDECFAEVRRRRHELRDENGRMAPNPASLYRRVQAYFETYRMGRTDQLAERFGTTIPSLRSAVQSVRRAAGEEAIKTLEQPQGGHGLYYRGEENVGVLIQSPDCLRMVGTPNELLLPIEAPARVAVMLHLGVVSPSSMTADIMTQIAEAPATTNELARRLLRDDVHIANVFNERVTRKLPLFGLSLKSKPANKFGLGRKQAYSLSAEPVTWEWDPEHLACDKAIEQLIKDHWGQLFGFARKVFNDEELAAEAIQDILASLLLKARVAPRETLGKLHLAYIYRAIRNKAISKGRQTRSRGKHIELDDVGEIAYSHSDLRPNAPSPEMIREAYDTRNQVLSALKNAELSGDQREAIELHYLHGLSTKEISEKTGTTLGSVHSRLHKGRAKLKAVLGESFFA